MRASPKGFNEAINIVIAGDNKRRLRLRESSLQKGGEKGSGFVELSGLPDWAASPVKKTKSMAPSSLIRVSRFATPDFTENTRAAPRFLLAGAS
jgi:hypothetical protein